MWIISFLPEWVFHLMLAVGIAGTVAGFVLGFIPLISKYKLPIQICSLLILVLALYIEGGIANEQIWKARVNEVEAKLAKAEAKSQEENIKIVEKVVKKTEYIKTRGRDIITYIDKEVVKDKDVIKYIEQCPAIPQAILKAHNDAAAMRNEVTK